MTVPLSDVHVFIQAGGKGTRLYPATAQLPKPMLEVGGRPMIERLVRSLVRAGLNRITVITGHLGEVVQHHLQGLIDLQQVVRLDFFAEPAPLGNVGALGRVTVERPLALLTFGDLVTDLDFAELVARYDLSGADILLASHDEDHRLQLGELIVEGTRVADYREKPLKRFLICSGIGLFRHEALSVIPTDGRPCGLVDLITGALARGYSVEHWKHGAFWMDINSLEALHQANEQLAQRLSGD